MTKKVYRSAQGKSIDLGALQLQNETVRAVGNMNVNARGDKLNPRNETVSSRNKTLAKQYKKQVTNVVDDVVYTDKSSASKSKNKKQKTSLSDVEKTVKQMEQEHSTKTAEKNVETTVDPAVELTVEPGPKKQQEPVKKAGLADAIAKAKSIKQEPMKTPRQLAQEKAGVKKI